MIFSEDVFMRIVIAILALGGFLVAKHIYKHKKPESTPLVCPVKFDCHTVVHSNYSKFLGIHLEILGMIYYSFIFVAYFILIFLPDILPFFIIFLLFLFSMGAFLFSIYLIGVQLFILKKGCSWCFISAFISILIFILTIFAYDFFKIIQVLIN